MGVENTQNYVPLNPNNPAGGSTVLKDDSRFITKIGNQSFYIEVWISNQMEDYPPFAISTKFIEELVIDEKIDNWNTNGYITINTDYEVLERGAPIMYDGAKVKDPYLVRTDGRNKLFVRILPILEDPDSTSSIDYKLYFQNWEMCYNFVINDVEDLHTEKSSIKLKRFYFWDERYQILSERNLEWSTATHGTNGGNPSSDDITRSMPITDAVKSIIKTASSNKFKSEGTSDVKIGFADHQCDMAIFSDEWDRGVSSGNANENEGNILYTSPANYTAIDDLAYILSLFKAEDGTPALLNLDRFFVAEGKRFSLKSLKKMIIDAEKNQIERLLIDDLVDPELTGTHFNRAPSDVGTDKNFTSPIASLIRKYNFSQMSPKDDMGFINSPVHNFSFKENEFRIYKTNNSIKKFVENTKKVLSEGLYSFKQGSGSVLLNLNKTKSEGLATKNILLPQTFFPTDYSFLSNFINILLLNQSIYFVANGLTIRTPGKFIYIDRPLTTQDKNSFDDRFLGQWLITGVVHKFTKSTYTTEVFASKTDIFNKYWEEVEDIY